MTCGSLAGCSDTPKVEKILKDELGAKTLQIEQTECYPIEYELDGKMQDNYWNCDGFSEPHNTIMANATTMKGWHGHATVNLSKSEDIKRFEVVSKAEKAGLDPKNVHCKLWVYVYDKQTAVDTRDFMVARCSLGIEKYGGPYVRITRDLDESESIITR